ncbi:MAG: flippase [Clostridia bacterium]|nr:flippase [Clostridia bacterium]
MAKNKSIKLNYIFNLAYQLLLIVVPLVTAPYLSRVLTPNGVGTYSYTFSIVSYFVLFATLGTTTFGQRAIGYTQDNVEERSRAFWETFIFRTITSVFTLAVYFVVFCVIGSENVAIYAVFALNIVNIIFDISWFLQGMEEFGKTVLGNAVCKILSVVCIFLFVKDSSDLVIYAAIMMGFTLLGSMQMWVFLPKYISKVKGINPFRSIKDILQLFVPTIAIQLYTVLDKSMIGWFTETNEQNGFYEQSEKIVKIALTVVTSLGAVMIPRIAHMFKTGETEKVKEFLYTSYRFVWMISIPICFGLFVVSDVFVPVFFGEGYEPCILLIKIFCPLIIFIGISNVTGLQFLVPTGKNNVFTLTVAVGAVINLILNLFLIPRYFAVGASIASIIAEFCVTVCGFIYVAKTKAYKILPILISSWKYWIAAAIMFLVLYFVKPLFNVSVLSLVLLILIGIAVYFISLLALVDKFLIDAIKRAFSVISSNLKRK